MNSKSEYPKTSNNGSSPNVSARNKEISTSKKQSWNIQAEPFYPNSYNGADAGQNVDNVNSVQHNGSSEGASSTQSSRLNSRKYMPNRYKDSNKKDSQKALLDDIKGLYTAASSNDVPRVKNYQHSGNFRNRTGPHNTHFDERKNHFNYRHKNQHDHKHSSNESDTSNTSASMKSEQYPHNSKNKNKNSYHSNSANFSDGAASNVSSGPHRFDKTRNSSSSRTQNGWNRSNFHRQNQNDDYSRKSKEYFQSRSNEATTNMNSNAGKSLQNDNLSHLSKARLSHLKRQNFRDKSTINSGKLSRDENRFQKSDVSPNGTRDIPLKKDNSLDNFEEHSLKDRLIEQLGNGSYECMVCCEWIRQTSPIWSCSKCFHCFHLYCVKKWSQCDVASVADGNGWRCPGCQNIITKVPNKYFCFCGKKYNPWWNRHDPPHTCGEICNKHLKENSCPHVCSSYCHPGPCDTCALTISMKCECGKSEQMVRCGQKQFIVCDEECNKELNCGIHVCKAQCHPGDCEPCQETIVQSCLCGKEIKEVSCSTEAAMNPTFNCHSVCAKLLSCGHHKCKKDCHDGDCGLCHLSPGVVKYCPCGKKALDEMYSSGDVNERKNCTDAIPTCGEKCGKELICGPEGNHHRCQSQCHLGECPPCPLMSLKECYCAFQSQEISCSEVKESNFSCEKRCNKKLSCKRHKCLEKCCTKLVHTCQMICDRKLSCKIHNCSELCHRGDCHSCWQVSFDELRCHCGVSVLYPPVPCGTKPPDCSEICSRLHACDHSVQHKCHSDENCPPCTFLTSKWCYGKHELRKNVPCYLQYISCGMPCGKPLRCGIHECIQTCHSGDCPETCNQLCKKPRQNCNHPCNLPCHSDTDCPDTVCKFKVSISCECGRRKEHISCSDYAKPYISTAKLAVKANDIRSGKSVNIKEIISKGKGLECDTECAAFIRNQHLALALQIQNPDISSKLGPPPYSDWLKDQTRNNTNFVSEIIEKLNDLVLLAKDSKQKIRSIALPPMKKDHRRIIHELSEYYGCETLSVDKDPNRMVIINAAKEKSWIPSTSILTVVKREMGIRKVPPPALPGMKLLKK